MKKLFLSALAIASLVACSKDELVSQPKPMAISFEQAFIENATRVETAEDPSIETETINGFDVWGFMDKPAGTVFVNQDVNRTDAETGAWTYNPLQYWLPGYTYYFGALAPMNSPNWKLDTANANTFGAGVVSFTNDDGTEDLLYAATTASTVGMNVGDDMETVKLTFNHLLSKVKFSFTNGFTSDNAKIVVKNVKMVVPKAATINLAQEDWWSTNKWENYSKETFALEFGDVNNENSKLAMGLKEEAAYERLTIPTDVREYAISFDVELYMGEVLALKSTKSTTVNVALEIGKAYNFCTVLDASNIADEELKPIVFEVVKVKEWVEAGVVDLYNVTASTEEELIAALRDGKDKNIAITSDLTLTEPIKVTGGDVIINLGGHKINTNVDGFEVADGTLTINGEGEITAAADNGTPYCAVWAYGDAVVNIYGGTYGIGYPAGDYNDLIYAKGNATINIYAGTFHNSGRENSFVLNLKDADRATAKINVYGGKYEKFDPANNNSEGPGTNFVAPGYKSVQNGDWYEVYAL